MTYPDAIAYIEALPRFAKVVSLKPMLRLVEKLDNPQEHLPCIHIAGTNGKGSTTSMIAHILTQAGYKTGLCVSPYVVDFRERFQIDGKMISQERLLFCFEKVRQAAELVEAEGLTVTGFVFMTAMALLYFYEEQCDVICLETGLGGRLDASNVFSHPLVCAITSIGLDHVEVLGDTPQKIAVEKCGILRDQVPVVCYADQLSGVRAVIQKEAEKCNSPFVLADERWLKVESKDFEGTHLSYCGKRFTLPLLGDHQIKNTATVLTIVEVLRGEGFSIPFAAVKEGIAMTHFPARCEVFRREPLWLLDGAHNESGAQSLAGVLRDYQVRDALFVMGMLGEKAIRASLTALRPYIGELYCLAPPSKRALSAQDFSQQAREVGISQIEVYQNPKEALQRAMRRSLKEKRPLVLCGSLYLASQLRPLLQEATK